MPGSRQVRLGLSASTVPRPTRIASCLARRRCPCARASGPVIQTGAPLPLGRQPVGADRELQRHGGAAFGDAEDVAERDRCRLLGEHALLDLDAGRDQPLDAAARRARVGIAQRDHGARGA